MLKSAVAFGTVQLTATMTVCGEGNFARAVAAQLARSGVQVTLSGSAQKPFSGRVRTWSNEKAQNTKDVLIDVAHDDNELRKSDVIIVATDGITCAATVEEIAPYLQAGQTIFIVGAAFGAALEAGYLLDQQRNDLAVQIVEVTQPFDSYKVEGEAISIYGARRRLSIAGRTLNETRAGLLAGNRVFCELVPASNLLDRGFSNINNWLEAAGLLFTVLQSTPSKTTDTVIAAFNEELRQIAKAYGVRRLPQQALMAGSHHDPVQARDILAQRIIEEMVLLSNLASLKHLSVPVLNVVIDLSSVITGVDLRKEARQLSDLGLLGMDAQEIVEHVSA